MRKDYYYIGVDGNHCELSTCNLEHQAKIEKHMKDKSSKYIEDPLTGELIKVKKMVKYLDVDGKLKLKDMNFVTLLEPLPDLAEAIRYKEHKKTI